MVLLLFSTLFHHFSTITTPLTYCMKGTSFVWTPEADVAFETIKSKHTSTQILALPDFPVVFELYCDACDASFGEFLVSVLASFPAFFDEYRQVFVKFIISFLL